MRQKKIGFQGHQSERITGDGFVAYTQNAPETLCLSRTWRVQSGPLHVLAGQVVRLRVQ